MAYNKTNWTETTGITPARLNKLETQYDKAVEDATAQAEAYTNNGIAAITPASIGAETPSGAQAKANKAELDAKNASVAKGTIPTAFVIPLFLGEKNHNVGVEALDEYRILWNDDFAINRNVYLEGILKSNDGTTGTISLQDESASLVGSVSTTSNNVTRLRSSALSLEDGVEYEATLQALGGDITFYCARLIIE